MRRELQHWTSSGGVISRLNGPKGPLVVRVFLGSGEINGSVYRDDVYAYWMCIRMYVNYWCRALPSLYCGGVSMESAQKSSAADESIEE